MSGKRCTSEFKEEAVKQVIERGYTVREVAKRRDVSAHSLYKWVRAVRGNSNGKKADGIYGSRKIHCESSPGPIMVNCSDFKILIVL